MTLNISRLPYHIKLSAPEIESTLDISKNYDSAARPAAWRPNYYPRPKEALKEYIRKRDHYTCQLCGIPAKHVDHIIPLEISHNNFPSNLRVLCHRCNLITGKRLAKFQLSYPGLLCFILGGKLGGGPKCSH